MIIQLQKHFHAFCLFYLFWNVINFESDLPLAEPVEVQILLPVDSGGEWHSRREVFFDTAVLRNIGGVVSPPFSLSLFRKTKRSQRTWSRAAVCTRTTGADRWCICCGLTMSMYGSQKNLNNMGRRVPSKGDISGGMNQFYARSELVHGGSGGGGNGYEPFMDGFTSSTFSRTSMGGGGMK